MDKQDHADAAARTALDGDNVIPFRRPEAGADAALSGRPQPGDRDLVDISDLAAGVDAPGWRGGESPATAGDLWVGADVLESLAGEDAALPLVDDFGPDDLEQLIQDGKDESR